MELKFVIESILFSAQKPLSPAEIRDLLKKAVEFEDSPQAGEHQKTRLEDIESALATLRDEHEQAGRSYRLLNIAGAWQFASQPEFAPWIKALVGQKPRPPKLSAPALETLAIVAYRQPITRAEMEQIRGVAVDGVMGTLVERGLIEQSGKAEAPGRPGLYSTTPLFLEYFGLGGLDDLPDAEELRRIPVKKPEELLTVDPGLATTAPEQLQLAPQESSGGQGSSAAGKVTEGPSQN
ncbi:MAG TPA: SMC-Scp complex subunit ScpB [Verrucomicrobiales bacterium]|nr:SMC-Scp complex subunit ScpB [Verrucomicrobiales bacterium]